MSPHTLRHSFATHPPGRRLRSEGGPGDARRHADVATTQMYTHLTGQQLRDVYYAAHPAPNPAEKPDPVVGISVPPAGNPTHPRSGPRYGGGGSEIPSLGRKLTTSRSGLRYGWRWSESRR